MRVTSPTPGSGSTQASSAGAMLSALAEAALLRELLRAWHQINQASFRSALLAPSLELSDSQTRLGEWRTASRSLLISRHLVLTVPWGSVLEVLKHEMAHQYVSELLGQPDETAHGPAFRALCERLGIDGTAQGLPVAVPHPDDPAARILQRVSRLLALAESQNPHEADAAMQTAQRLMLKYNLDAQQRPPVSAQVPRGYRFRHLGGTRQRVQEHERLLSVILQRHFFVETIWVPSFDVATAHRGSTLEICGSEENLELAAYVYEFLSRTAERLWQEHLRLFPATARSERRTFLSGVMQGFHDRLSQEKKQQQAQGLVWVGDPGLDGYLRRRHPQIRRVASRAQSHSEARTEGRRQGREIVLHRPLQAGKSPGSPTLALPPRR